VAVGAAPRVGARCGGCGRTAAATVRAIAAGLRSHRRPDAWQILPGATADLDTRWFVPTGTGSWREARSRVRCAPAGAVWPVECGMCFDGPIVVLDAALPGMPINPRTL